MVEIPGQGTDAAGTQGPVSGLAPLSRQLHLPDLAEDAEDREIFAALTIIDNLLLSLTFQRDLLIHRSSSSPDVAIEKKKQLLCRNAASPVAIGNVDEEQALRISQDLKTLLKDKGMSINQKSLRDF